MAKAYTDPQDSLLLQNLLSDNVGGVKLFSTTLLHALGEERHFALAEAFP
jgi:hypothetical protein